MISILSLADVADYGYDGTMFFRAALPLIALAIVALTLGPRLWEERGVLCQYGSSALTTDTNPFMRAWCQEYVITQKAQSAYASGAFALAGEYYRSLSSEVFAFNRANSQVMYGLSLSDESEKRALWKEAITLYSQVIAASGALAEGAKGNRQITEDLLATLAPEQESDTGTGALSPSEDSTGSSESESGSSSPPEGSP